MIQNLYLIKRNPPDYPIAVPFHRVIICALKRVMERVAGWSGDKAWVWEKQVRFFGFESGWLLTRWNGLDIDYGHVVRALTLPDGTQAAVWRDYPTDGNEGSVQYLLPDAVWYSDKPMPEWLQQKGVVYPCDDFTQQDILDLIADGPCWGCGRAIPDFWPEPADRG